LSERVFSDILLEPTLYPNMTHRIKNKLIISNLVHRPVRSALTILAIAVEVAMILSLVGISYGTLDESARRARGVGADILVRPPGSSVIGLSMAPLSDKLLSLLLTVPHITSGTGTLVQPLSGLDTITGIDFDQFTTMSGGFRFIHGGPLKDEYDVIVDEYYAREHHIKVGDQLALINRHWKVVGIFESGKLARLCVKLSTLQELTGSEHHLSQIFLKVDDPRRAPDIVRILKEKLPDYPIYTIEEFTSLLTISSVGLLKNFIGVVIGISTTVGFIVVFMAMYTAVLERTRDIGILKALGANSALIVDILFREAIALAITGTLFGIALTYFAQWVVNNVLPNSLKQETVYGWWPIAAGVAVLGALLGSILPAVKAAKKDPIEALAYE
jgi:putative ABC transport system permease protein